MIDVGLLEPGFTDDADDLAVTRALIEVEADWVRLLAAHGLIEPPVAAAIVTAADTIGSEARLPDTARQLAVGAADTANPVLPLLTLWRASLDDDGREALHRGLTSQDVMDTALAVVLTRTARDLLATLDEVVGSLVTLGEAHADAPVLAHTLGQAALPTTFGHRTATWIQAVGEARNAVGAALPLPVSCAGPVGAGVEVGSDAPIPAALVDSWASALGLAATATTWHTTRFPILRLGAALTETCAALGKLAADVLEGTRSEVGELTEPGEHAGASTSMQFKHNPVLSVMMRRSAIAAPGLLAQLYTAAGMAGTERPDGAWHAEWPAIRGLARHAIASARLGQTLARGLEFHEDAAARAVDAHGQGSAPTTSGRTALAAVRAQYAHGGGA